MLRIHERKGVAVVTVGKGMGSNHLSAFDNAELSANILALNAVKFSSFIPPGWVISTDKFLLSEHTHSGKCLPMAYEFAHSTTNVVSAVVVVGVPKNKTKPCIIMEYSSKKLTKEELVEKAIEGVREVFSFRGWELEKIVTKAVEVVPKKNQYACALAAVVFIPELRSKGLSNFHHVGVK